MTWQRLRAPIILVVVALLTGCAGLSTTARLAVVSSYLAARLSPPARRPAALPPSKCTPTLWVSVTPPSIQRAVIGFNGGLPCMTITGSPSELFTYALGIATDADGFLYVADIHRIVVFTRRGEYWSTLGVGRNVYAMGVCVAPNGTVGAVIASKDSTGAVVFFPTRGTRNSITLPSSYSPSPGILNNCAFDRRGDFFADSEGSGPILYLRNSSVNTRRALLRACDAPACRDGNHEWASLYSHIRTTEVNTLSVTDLGPSAPKIVNFKVELGPPNQLTFVRWPRQPTTLLSNYPTLFVCQSAPTAGRGKSSHIYLTDCFNNVYQVEKATTGGVVMPFAVLTGATGVATEPTGQY